MSKSKYGDVIERHSNGDKTIGCARCGKPITVAKWGTWKLCPECKADSTAERRKKNAKSHSWKRLKKTRKILKFCGVWYQINVWKKPASEATLFGNKLPRDILKVLRRNS